MMVLRISSLAVCPFRPRTRRRSASFHVVRLMPNWDGGRCKVSKTAVFSSISLVLLRELRRGANGASTPPSACLRRHRRHVTGLRRIRLHRLLWRTPSQWASRTIARRRCRMDVPSRCLNTTRSSASAAHGNRSLAVAANVLGHSSGSDAIGLWRQSGRARYRFRGRMAVIVEGDGTRSRPRRRSSASMRPADGRHARRQLLSRPRPQTSVGCGEAAAKHPDNLLARPIAFTRARHL